MTACPDSLIESRQYASLDASDAEFAKSIGFKTFFLLTLGGKLMTQNFMTHDIHWHAHHA